MGEFGRTVLTFDTETIPDISVINLLCPHLISSYQTTEQDVSSNAQSVLERNNQSIIKLCTHMVEESKVLEDANLLCNNEDDRVAGGCKLCFAKELSKVLENYHLQITDGRNPFPRQLFHKIIAISCVIASECDDEMKIQFIGTGKIKNSDINVYDSDGIEKFILKNFNEYTQRGPKLVTFNGRGFDIPVVKYRLMKHGLSNEVFFRKGYAYRYELENNCDLLEAMSDFGASARIKLEEICALLSIPCKSNMHGSDVLDKFYDGKIEEIRDYCDIDALSTFIIYLRYMILCGRMTANGYNKTVDNIIHYINSDQTIKHNENINKKHLQKFIQEWELLGQMYLK